MQIMLGNKKRQAYLFGLMKAVSNFSKAIVHSVSSNLTNWFHTQKYKLINYNSMQYFKFEVKIFQQVDEFK